MPTNQFIDNLLDGHTAAPTAITSNTNVSFTLKKFVLAALLDKAASVIPSRDVMPVLRNFQIEAGPQRLRVTATDLELSVVAATTLVEVTSGGVAVFPAKKMLDILREAEDATVTVQVTGSTASVRIGRTTWTLKLQGGADYPPMPEFAEAVYAPIDRAKFASALANVRYAACRDANRASLMMIDVRGGRMTACDGARFQQATIGEFPFELRIPIGAVDDLLKLLRSTDLPEITVGESVNHLIFTVGTDIFVANKLMAQFPDMEALLLRPALENKHRLAVERDELQRAIKRTRINADHETSAIGVHLTNGHLTVMARDKYGNDATETIDADWNEGERTLVVNHAYLTDLLAATSATSATFRLGDDTRTRKAPIMLRDDDAGTIGVVQQMVSDWASS